MVEGRREERRGEIMVKILWFMYHFYLFLYDIYENNQILKY